jgi:DNA-binding protein HU-beta
LPADADGTYGAVGKARFALDAPFAMIFDYSRKSAPTCPLARPIVESVFKEISDAARSGSETSIPGFGKFKVKDTPAREGRNPSTGATIKIAASRKLTFAPAKAVKDALNG